MAYNWNELMANKVEEGLWLGNWRDAKTAKSKGWDTLCVIETPRYSLLKHNTYYIPILEHNEAKLNEDWYSLAVTLPPKALTSQLDKCVEVINTSLESDKELLVHCWEGRERSPLTLVYWLVKTRRYQNGDKAYEYLQSIRPIVEDRREWLEKDVKL